MSDHPGAISSINKALAGRPTADRNAMSRRAYRRLLLTQVSDTIEAFDATNRGRVFRIMARFSTPNLESMLNSGARFHREYLHVLDMVNQISQLRQLSQPRVHPKAAPANYERFKTSDHLPCKCNDNITCMVCNNVCCDRASILPCTCRLSYECAFHGHHYRCVGSHS